MTSSLVGARDYLALRLKPTEIQLTGRQRDAVRAYLVNSVPAAVLNPFARMDAGERRKIINEALEECIRAGTLIHSDYTSEHHRERFASPTETLVQSMYAQTVGLDAMEPLLQDDEVTSITVINEGMILYEKGGHTYQSPFGFESRDRMVEVIKNLAIRGGQQLTPAQPTADLAFPPPQVVRIHLTINPVTPRYGGFCALRRGREKAWTLETLVSKGMMDDDVADFLRALMRIPASIIVGGEPASGKTTLLEVLLSMVEGQHISLLEEAAELNPRNRLISFFEVPPDSDTVSLATLTIDSLRKNVQVVVVGETRGSEAGWLLFIAGAMKAILTTLHGRNSRQVVERLAANAQIKAAPPLSPYVGNKQLAKEAVANAFDFVVHCTQLPDGRRIITSIEHVTGIKNGDICLDMVVKAEIEVSEMNGGSKQVVVNWRWMNQWRGKGNDENSRWQLPEDLAFALKMADVRGEVSKQGLGGNAVDTHQHELYQRACLSLDQEDYAQAVRLLTELLRTAPTANYLDAESKLRQAMRAMGQWDDLLRMAGQFIDRIKTLVRDREWKQLSTAINDLDNRVDLRIAVNARQDLRELREQLQKGLSLEQKWASARRRVKTMIAQGKARLAAASLRQVPVENLNREFQDEVRRLRLETLDVWLNSSGVSADHALRIYHEMFALIDEELEPDRMLEIASKIQELEGQTGAIEVDLAKLNVATYTRSAGDKISGQHQLYLNGVLAMNENRWADALQYFSQIPGYRRTDVFIKSLEALQND